jgi:hypothetical protein
MFALVSLRTSPKNCSVLRQFLARRIAIASRGPLTSRRLNLIAAYFKRQSQCRAEGEGVQCDWKRHNDRVVGESATGTGPDMQISIWQYAGVAG